MRKIFMFCLTGALALATTSCKDEKVTTMQTITVNGQICEVKSAFYVEEKADEQWETSYDLILFREYFSTLPFTMSDYGVDIEVSEFLIGKTIDLTEPGLSDHTSPSGQSVKQSSTSYTRLKELR